MLKLVVWPKDPIQKWLEKHVLRLDLHNLFHGKNVVFWSCKKCNYRYWKKDQ